MTSVVHDRKQKTNNNKTTFHSTKMAHTHTEKHICNQTQFSVANFSLGDSDDICDPE